MVYIQYKRFIESGLEKFYLLLSDVLEELNFKIEENIVNEELLFIRNELLEMQKKPIDDNKFSPNYPFVLNMLLTPKDELYKKLYTLYVNFNFYKSLTKQKIHINNNISEDKKIFIKKSDKILDDLILEIFNANERNDKKMLMSLQKIKNEIEKMRIMLSKEKYLPSFNRWLIDSWESDNNLLKNELLTLEYEYEKL